MTGLEKLRNVKGIRGALYRLGQVQARTAFTAGAVADFLRLRRHHKNLRPSLHAVVVGRNHVYLSNFALRFEATIAWNIKYLATEVVFVEWNPPADRELLSIRLAQLFTSLRAYVVHREIHQAICENPRIQLLEYHAKNVGIRRANTDWIVT